MADIINDDKSKGQSGDQSSQAGSDKFFDIKDPVTGESFQFPDTPKHRELFGHIISHERKKTDSKYKPVIESIDQYKNTNQELAKKLQEIEESSMSEKEKFEARLQRERQQLIEKHESSQKEALSWKNRHFDATKENEIMKALGAHKGDNPPQTAMVLMQEGNAKVIEDENGKLKTVLTIRSTDSKGNVFEEDLSPKDAVEKFLAREENAHHLVNNLRPGGGTATTGRKSADGSIYYKRSEVSDPSSAQAKEYAAKKKNNEPVYLVDG